MKFITCKTLSLNALLILLQITTFQVYFYINIVNVGQFGSALFVLVLFFIFSLLVNYRIFYKNKFAYEIRIHFLIFIALLVWVTMRVVIDLNDLEYLKQITVATTGGVLLFYCIGALLGLSLHKLQYDNSSLSLNSISLLVFLCLNIWMIYNFSMRLSSNYFYLEGVGGAYQRSGNFLSITFIVASYIYIARVFCFQREKKINSSIFFFVYVFFAFIALVSSQLFGSNSATAVITGVFLITLVIAFVASHKRLISAYMKGLVKLPFSRRLLRLLLSYSFYVAFFCAVFLIGIILFTGFDISSLRVFGFGSVINDSLQARFEILYQEGALQLSYSPWLGNMNVAYLVSGSPGRTLHNFLPYVLANLGLVGLFLVLFLYFVIFFQLCRNNYSRFSVCSFRSFLFNMKSLYSVFILLYLFIFANLATDLTWPVLWFTVAFFSLPIDVKWGALK